MEKQYFIYLTTNLINGKKYIGYHYGYEDDSYLGSGVNILKAIKKYGAQNFDRIILEFCADKEEACQKEKYWIKYYNAVQDENFYNISEGGEFDAGWYQARKWRENNPELAEEHDRQAILRLQKWWKNHPEELKQNNEKLIQQGKQWRESNPEKVEEIMKKVNQGRIKWQQEHPEEHKAQVQKWIQAGSIANSKKIICITTGEIFNSISEAARAYEKYGCQQSNISKVLRGERKSCGKKDGQKLQWKFLT